LSETANAAGARLASAKVLANKAVATFFFITHLLSFPKRKTGPPQLRWTLKGRAELQSLYSSGFPLPHRRLSKAEAEHISLQNYL